MFVWVYCFGVSVYRVCLPSSPPPTCFLALFNIEVEEIWYVIAIANVRVMTQQCARVESHRQGISGAI